MITHRFFKRLLPLLSLSLLMPWPAAYAMDVASVAQGSVQIQVAEASAAPCWTAFGKAIGGVTTPADLFYIDTTSHTADVMATLYLTNASELAHSYRYLILEVGIYRQTDTDEWEKINSGNDGPAPASYITLHNGQVSFPLNGYAQHKVTIDSGSFYCITANAEGGSISPRFYLTVN